MKWRLYKKDDPNSWPQIECPMVVYCPFRQYHDSEHIIFMCRWDNDRKQFFTPKKWWDEKELYYAYVGYVPSGYKTHEVLKCMNDDDCKIGCDDNGYCMYDFYKCEQQRRVNEYTIEEKAIWKEFE